MDNIKFVFEGKTITLNTYVMQPITATGSYSSYSDKWSINLSSVFTYLIHRVGRYTEYYASDLFYELEAIKNALNEYNVDGKTFLIGIRYSGVDGNESISAKIRNKSDLNMEYIDGVYMLQFTQNGDQIKAIFGKTNI